MSGIPLEALDFYEDLEADNSRTFWSAHKDVYDRCVRAPMEALLTGLAEEFGSAKLFRPHRDVRFSADKSPYKTHQGGYVEASGGVGYYVQVSASGLLVSAGWWRASGSQIPRFRTVVAGPGGAVLEHAVDRVRACGFEVQGDRLQRAPRGVAPDAPRIELLKHKSLYASRDHGAPDWLATGEATARVAAEWRALTPLVQALVDAVGPADDGRPG